MDDQVLHQFTSHISGKNAKVRVYVDRVEWDRPRGLSTGKLTTGLMTGGLSLAATGVRGGKGSGTEMIPIKSMSSVTTARDGMLNTKVVIVTSGNTIDMRVSHGEAKEIKETLTRLILGTHPAQQQGAAPQHYSAPPPPQPVAYQPPPAPTAPAVPSLGDRLNQLDSLRNQGILTEQEYATKRAAILAEL